jgi:AAA+ superfamily predicted ATPase
VAAREGIVLSDGEQALRNVLESYVQTRRPAVLMLKRVRAEQVARVLESLSFRTLALALLSLPQDDEAALDACRCVLRNARMYGAALLIQQLEELQNSRAALLERLAPLLASADVPLIALEERHAAIIRLAGIAQVTYELPALSARERAEALSQWIDRNEPVDVLGLSRRFSFAPEELADIHHEAAFYQQQRAPGKVVSQQAWMQALSDRARQNFGNLAQRVKPQRQLDDLIISNDLHRQLSEILAAIRHREARLEQGFQHKVQYGTGISALFYGPSGTGKTMAAEVLAKTIQLDLIKIDLSAVVNKYIGETEKNLARIFDLAEADAGVLFFDEADALFGKRSEVKDAHDRHANIEVSYLLQRLESYPGLVILATNNRAHMDEAFTRRFTFVTRFQFPDAALRERMWRAIWPNEITVDNGVDFADLARRIEVTGASIRNIALLASWLAHAEGTNDVMARHLEQASLRELAKAGRLKI